MGVVYLGRSLEYERDNRLAATWLWSELVLRRGRPRPGRAAGSARPARRSRARCSARTAQRVIAFSGSASKRAGEVQQWDAATGQPSLGPREDQTKAPSAARGNSTRDGQRLLISRTSDGIARQYDLATGQPVGNPLVPSRSHRRNARRLSPACRTARTARRFSPFTWAALSRMSPPGRSCWPPSWVQQFDADTGQAIGAVLRQRNELFLQGGVPAGREVDPHGRWRWRGQAVGCAHRGARR